MNRKILAILVVNVFLLVTVVSVVPVHAQGTGQWITAYTITSLQTGDILRQIDYVTGQNVTKPILAGADLNVTVTIQISTSSPNTQLQLSTELTHSAIQGTFWELQTKTYPGISATTYNPNQATVSFTQTAGTLVISCYGQLGTGITQTPVGNGITLDKKTDANLVKLTDPAGNQLDKVAVSVSDAKINQFDGLYSAAMSQIANMQQNGVDPAYIALYQSILAGAQNQASQGLVDNAIGTLQNLAATQGSVTPTTTGTPLESTLFFPLVGVLAALVVVMALLFFRARGRVGYDKLVIEDQIKDLEGLTLRAQKIDKNIAISLDSVKERLKSLVGA